MSNSYFKFQQFTIQQDACAMKVGTDGVLLGAWAAGGERILDIGTGTGLIALMMAQRFPKANVVGIEIDGTTCEQARENVLSSPFLKRVEMIHCSAKKFILESEWEKTDRLQEAFDAIVSNPPYFNNALKNPDPARKTARHTDSLTYAELFQVVSVLLTDDGVFSAVIPFDCLTAFLAEAEKAKLFLLRICAVRTTPKKMPRRYLLAFGKHQIAAIEKTEEVLETEFHERSKWYEELTGDFYLKHNS